MAEINVAIQSAIEAVMSDPRGLRPLGVAIAIVVLVFLPWEKWVGGGEDEAAEERRRNWHPLGGRAGRRSRRNGRGR